MFKYFKEMRELKLAKLRGEVIILNTICGFINGSSDILELANKLKGVDQKDVVAELVKYMKLDKTEE